VNFPVNCVLEVTDGYFQGDQYEVFNLLGSIGSTSVPVTTCANVLNDWDTAFADAGWSSGSFSLSAGVYSITGVAIASPFGGGAGALRVDVSAVPLPAAIWLFGTGLLGLIGFSKCRKSA
jgi:hypothetical protein